MINNSREIIRHAVEKAEEPRNKYNPSLIRSVEDFGVVAADYRDGSDTGSEMEIKK